MAGALLALAAVLFLGFGIQAIGAPFGDSHDGRNGAVWATGSRSPSRMVWLDTAVAATAAAFAVLLTVGAWQRPNASAWAIQEGRRAGTLVGSRALDPEQDSAWYTGAIGKPPVWLALATGRPAVAVALPDLAATHPQDLVLVGRLGCVNREPHIAYAYESTQGVVVRPPEIDRC